MNDVILSVTLNPALDKSYFVDNFSINGVYRPKKMLCLPGGKGINVARVIRALGGSVIVTGFAGGVTGKLIINELRKSEIACDFQEIKSESRFCINIVDTVTKTSTEILENGPEITNDELQAFLKKYEQLISLVKIVVFSGSVPKTIPESIYKTLINMARKKGLITILDSSGLALLEGIEAKPYMIKPNQIECEKAFNVTLNGLDKMLKLSKRIHAKGVQLFSLSLGERGSFVSFENKVYRILPPKINVVNSVGCGDAYVAGFAMGFAKGFDIIEIMKLSTATAASNALHYGAGIVDINEVKQLINEVKINLIEDIQ